MPSIVECRGVDGHICLDIALIAYYVAHANMFDAQTNNFPHSMSVALHGERYLLFGLASF